VPEGKRISAHPRTVPPTDPDPSRRLPSLGRSGDGRSPSGAPPGGGPSGGYRFLSTLILSCPALHPAAPPSSPPSRCAPPCRRKAWAPWASPLPCLLVLPALALFPPSWSTDHISAVTSPLARARPEFGTALSFPPHPRFLHTRRAIPLLTLSHFPGEERRRKKSLGGPSGRGPSGGNRFLSLLNPSCPTLSPGVPPSTPSTRCGPPTLIGDWTPCGPPLAPCLHFLPALAFFPPSSSTDHISAVTSLLPRTRPE